MRSALLALLLAGCQKPTPQAQYWCRLYDAHGLKERRTDVEISGVAVGKVVQVTLEDRVARVRLVLPASVPVYSNATLRKGTGSLLGEVYLALDPGTEMSVDALGNALKTSRLKDGDAIVNVLE